MGRKKSDVKKRLGKSGRVKKKSKHSGNPKRDGPKRGAKTFLRGSKAGHDSRTELFGSCGGGGLGKGKFCERGGVRAREVLLFAGPFLQGLLLEGGWKGTLGIA